MRADAGRICASCGTRNKPKWEFCVKCGEALVDLPADAGTTRAPADAGAGAIAWWPAVLSVLAVGASIAAFVYLRGVSPERPDPSLFSLGPPSTTLPAPVATPPAGALKRAELALTSGKPGDAVPLLAEAVSDEPGNARARRLYAQALGAVGDRAGAVEQWRVAANLAPEDREARFEQARGLDTLGRAPEAVEAYETLLSGAPDHTEALRLLGELRTRRKEYGQAVPLLQRLTERRPDDIAARQDLAFALEGAGDVAGAVNLYASVVESMPTASIARTRLAEALAAQGQDARAIALYNEGVSLQPKVPVFHRGLGSALERSGNAAGAAAAYREFLRLAPNDPDAKALAARVAKLEKKSAAS
jgi:Flp pilus assembly protein TadD